ncbi:GNAT family N-acetyltransferase [Streptococcus moroccensis]|uniref:Acetyltransferase n=1 Tax=Streptococcus moroccensis TaxID=1451356 RepID=A0ABT9YPY9_9STRE|nr:GNAT family N-acetyltransferase [Streptococcus moroccensis]MDQ0222057.1 putative acetyltransferase [Streptococcus moroccensis]
MQLRRPGKEDQAAIEEMMAEFIETGSAADGGFWNPENFHYDDWLQHNADAEMGINVPETFVPAIQFVSFEDSGRALGFLHLRLRLNDSLLQKGGHIGYSIRPSERGKGYAKEQLRLGLLECPKKNIQKALITCSETNPASRATIVANGGVLEDVREGTERYWVSTELLED